MTELHQPRSARGVDEAAARRRADRLDALAWLLLPALLLASLPIGFVSGDGLGQSLGFASGRWQLDPNHLLLEPLGAGWVTFWQRCGCRWHPADILKVLSALAGALAASLFRLTVAPRFAGTRLAANHATAWMAFSSAFLRLWVSDEIHMIQMPLVVAVAALALRRFERDRRGLSLGLGLAVGLAALAFISNLLLGVTLAAAIAGQHLRARAPRAALASAAAIGCGMALGAGPALLVAWLPRARTIGFFPWLLRYAGGAISPRVEGAYGIVPSASGLVEALVRAAYGTASSLVDLAATAAPLRDRQPPTFATALSALAFLAAAAALAVGGAAARRDARLSKPLLLLAAAWLAAIVGFGVFWNNSDDQFYFQLAPLFGAIAAFVPAATPRLRWLALVASAAALLWNLGEVTAQRVLYPRQRRMALVEREVAGACLVVYPGFDEVEVVLALGPHTRSAPKTSVVAVAIAEPATTGLPRLRRHIDACLAGGGRVVLLDVFDTPLLRSPWKYLRRVGYERAAVEEALAGPGGGGATRRVGPFTVREPSPRPRGSRR